MTIQENQVVIGSFYNAGNEQLRKVIDITKDNEGRNRVHYLSKSQKISGRKFNYGHTKANLPFWKIVTRCYLMQMFSLFVMGISF